MCRLMFFFCLHAMAFVFLQVESLKQQHEIREREFESRLRNVEEMNRRSVNELREMLTAQQRLGAQ